MNGNFLTSYDRKIAEYRDLIEKDPTNKKAHELAMSEYIIQCMPFMKAYADDDDEENVATTTTTNDDNIFNVTETKGLQRKDIYIDYLIDVERENLQRPIERVRDLCPRCEDDPESKLVWFPDTSELVCEKCGVVCKQQLISEELTFREEQETSKIIVYSYKRQNHFNEYISAFQAQEQTRIPEEVTDAVRAELKKMKITSCEEITQTRVRAILKKCRYNKYFEHVPTICSMITGVQPPKLSQRLEEQLRQMFALIQEPFDRHVAKVAPNRKNFLSYSFVTYKCLELLEEDHLLPYFNLLKSREKLAVQDRIWELICADLHWQYVPTC
jgi:hypothetical protein